jgi:hypothetical protein
MVEADSHLKLLPTSILNISELIEHIDMLSMGIRYQPCTVIPTLLGSDFGALGHLWSQNDIIMSWSRLTATSNCFTQNKDKEFDQHVWIEKRKHCLIDKIVDIALSETQIPLSIFTNLFHKRFQKHSMLESMLEILQQFYIQMETEPHDFLLFNGDSSLYTLRCMRYCKPVTVAGSTGETLLHALTAMLYHWNII